MNLILFSQSLMSISRNTICKLMAGQSKWRKKSVWVVEMSGPVSGIHGLTFIKQDGKHRRKSDRVSIMRIFVSVASYRDTELPFTIKSIVSKADHPENLHVSIVQQCTKRELIPFEHDVTPSRITNVWVHALDAKGAGYARSIAQQPYDGEDFFLQVDSHTRLIDGWDTKMIDHYRRAAKLAGTDKVILSQFPAPYAKESMNRDVFPLEHPRYLAHPTKQKLLWTKKGAWSAERVEMSGEEPEESHTVLAGFIFAPGSIVTEVPYDPEISFFGEELCFAIRAWTRGWKIYSPGEMLIWHFYHRESHAKIWDSGNNADKKWGKIEKFSMEKQAKVYAGKNLGIFGADSASKLQDYYKFIDLDVHAKFQNMLKTRNILSASWLEFDLIIGEDGIGTESLSIPCIDGEHEDSARPCGVAGCECKCHSKGEYSE